MTPTVMAIRPKAPILTALTIPLTPMAPTMTTAGGPGFMGVVPCSSMAVATAAMVTMVMAATARGMGRAMAAVITVVAMAAAMVDERWSRPDRSPSCRFSLSLSSPC
ncbi:hypothetical protein A9975_24210 [Cupriavidus sp. UME77]|nr:hypothetical protein [Cupriavidus sp. UME77]